MEITLKEYNFNEMPLLSSLGLNTDYKVKTVIVENHIENKIKSIRIQNNDETYRELPLNIDTCKYALNFIHESIEYFNKFDEELKNVFNGTYGFYSIINTYLDELFEDLYTAKEAIHKLEESLKNKENDTVKGLVKQYMETFDFKPVMCKESLKTVLESYSNWILKK